MENDGSGSSPNRYDFYRDLSLDEIISHLNDVETKIEGVITRCNESGRLTLADQVELAGYIGELLPMSHSAAVQEEALHTHVVELEDAPELTFNRVSNLLNRVLLYESTFEESGVVRLGGQHDLLT